MTCHCLVVAPRRQAYPCAMPSLSAESKKRQTEMIRRRLKKCQSLRRFTGPRPSRPKSARRYRLTYSYCRVHATNRSGTSTRPLFARAWPQNRGPATIAQTPALGISACLSSLSLCVFGAAFRPPTVGLDIGSSAVKAVVAPPRSRRAGRSSRPARRRCRRAACRTATAAEPTAVSEAVSQSARLAAAAPRARRRRALRSRRHRQAAVAAGDEPGRAERRDSLGGRAVHPVRPERGPARLPGRQRRADGAAKNSLDVLLVAAKKDRIDDRAGVIAQTGRRPVVLDIEAFALANAYQMNYPERTDALAALDPRRPRRRRSCACSRKGEPVFTRDISIGGQVHVDAIMRDLGPTGVDDAGGQADPARSVPDRREPRAGGGRAARGQRAARARSAQDGGLLPRDRAGREAQPHRAVRRRVSGRRPGRSAGE